MHTQGFDYHYLLVYLTPREMKSWDRGRQEDFRSKTELTEIKHHRLVVWCREGCGGGRGKMEPLILPPEKVLS